MEYGYGQTSRQEATERVTSATSQSPPIPSRQSLRSRTGPLLPRAGSSPGNPTFGHGGVAAAGDYGGSCSSRHSNYCYLGCSLTFS